MIAQSIDTEKRCDRLLELHRDFHARLKGGSLRLARLVDRLFVSPVITVAHYRQDFNVTYPTARSDLKKLEQLGILNEIPKMKAIAYFCPSIYLITYEGTHSISAHSPKKK